MYGFIYITTNSANGKRYLGMCSYHKAKSSTYLGSGKALKRAIIKYGKDKFTREIIAEASTKDELSLLEEQFILEFNCVSDPNWYNIASGGYTTRGFTGRKHRPETKAKMRANYKQPLTEDSKRRIGEAARKRIHKIQTPPIPVVVNGKSFSSLAEATRNGIKYHHAREFAGLIDKTKQTDRHRLVSCIHCKKTGQYMTMRRWHLENCRHKPSNDSTIAK